MITGSLNKSDKILKVTNEEPKINETEISIVQNITNDTKTSENIDENDRKEIDAEVTNQTDENKSNGTSNEQTIVHQSGISFNPNLSINKKRMRESVKKSTVVFEDDETQIIPTRNKTDITQAIENTATNTEVSTNPSTKFNSAQTKVDDTTPSATTTYVQTISDQRSSVDTNGRTMDSNISLNNLANITDKVSVLNYSESNKENLDIIDIIKTNDSTSDLGNTTNNQETNDNYLNVNQSTVENGTVTFKHAHMSTMNNAKSLNLETPANSNFNRNFTKIILYKSSNNENSSNQNASSTNDISRVQIHTNVQPNGVPFVENVKISDVEKYNESTIARLKQINEHITNVISKRNTTFAANATSGAIESNNATALHKLKHFITTIIDSHNNVSKVIIEGNIFSFMFFRMSFFFG